LYSINLLYIYYYYYVENQFQQENIIKKIINLLKKTLIYKILVNYIFIKDIVYVYEKRTETSILGTIIKKVLIKSFIKVSNIQENKRLKDNILILRKYLYEIPDSWRY
jgi:predicted transcriptional regulator